MQVIYFYNLKYENCIAKIIEIPKQHNVQFVHVVLLIVF